MWLLNVTMSIGYIRPFIANYVYKRPFIAVIDSIVECTAAQSSTSMAGAARRVVQAHRQPAWADLGRPRQDIETLARMYITLYI